MNIVPHPENRTISLHDDWQGGTWQESTYRWNDGKLELIEKNSLVGDGSEQSDRGCGFLFICSRLVKGEMTTTLEKQVCSPMDGLPNCPAATTTQEPKTLATKTAKEKKVP